MGDRPATTRRKKPGRKRRVAGWVLLVIGVLIAGVWGASRWWQVGYMETDWRAGVADGGAVIALLTSSPHQPAQWIADSRPAWEPHWIWYLDPRLVGPDDSGVNVLIAAYVRFQRPVGGYSGQQISIVLWPFALASLFGGGWLVWSGRRARRRAMTGVCLKCGYDLAGLAAGAPCPECGRSADV